MNQQKTKQIKKKNPTTDIILPRFFPDCIHTKSKCESPHPNQCYRSTVSLRIEASTSNIVCAEAKSGTDVCDQDYLQRAVFSHSQIFIGTELNALSRTLEENVFVVWIKRNTILGCYQERANCQGYPRQVGSTMQSDTNSMERKQYSVSGKQSTGRQVRETRTTGNSVQHAPLTSRV